MEEQESQRENLAASSDASRHLVVTRNPSYVFGPRPMNDHDLTSDHHGDPWIHRTGICCDVHTFCTDGCRRWLSTRRASRYLAIMIVQHVRVHTQQSFIVMNMWKLSKLLLCMYRHSSLNHNHVDVEFVTM